MSNNGKKILILADTRPGTYSQAIALAKEIGQEFEILNISYSGFVKIPNFIFPSSLFRYDRQTKEKLQNITDFPQIIISPGRRSVSAALYLKKKSQNKSKVVQIMDPNISADKLDLVVLPNHDKHGKHPNIIESVGAITSIDKNRIAKDKEKFSKLFNTDKKKAVLLVGGPSKSGSFGRNATIELVKASIKKSDEIGAKLFILTSPRTTNEMLEIIKSEVNADSHIFEYDKVKDNNPYFACIGYGDLFIVSGDSVSMISECCAVGKPVFIFDVDGVSGKKHKMFHLYLFENGYARDLIKGAGDNFEIQILNEARRIAEVVRDRFL